MHQSRVLNNIKEFKNTRPATDKWLMRDSHQLLMRGNEGMYLVWKTIEYFKPTTLLEIGFYKGQTMGIMLEDAGPGAHLVSVDIDYQYRSVFENIFPENTVKFIETDSKNLILDQTFDFIMIDGDHTYEGVLADLKNCFPQMHKNSILCVDDHQSFEGVAQVVKEQLLGQHGFVPFMCGPQQMFFCHQSVSVESFVDKYLINGATDFFEFNNIDFHGYTVLDARIPNRAIFESSKIFQLVLEFFNL